MTAFRHLQEFGEYHALHAMTSIDFAAVSATLEQNRHAAQGTITLAG